MPKVEAKLLLRVGLAFAFLYAAIAAFVEPENWLGYLPTYVSNFFLPLTREFILRVFSSFEIVLSLWLLWGKRLKIAALVSFITLAVITLLNLAVFDVVFRDVSIALAALALYDLAKKSEP